MRRRWWLAIFVGISPALALRVGKQSPDLPDERKRHEEGEAVLQLMREEVDVDLDADVQESLQPLREMMSGSTEDWQSGVRLTHTHVDPAERQCRIRNCSKPLAPLPPSKDRRTYIFIMGVEGAGHHAVCPFLEEVLRRTGLVVHTAAINMFGRNKILPFGTWKKNFLNETKGWCPSGICLNCFDSFPYERPISAAASPDFARMVALHDSGDIDLRVISVMRNISDSVFSAMRRFTEDPVEAFSSARHFFMEVVRNTDWWQREHCERLGTIRYEDLMDKTVTEFPSVFRALGMESPSRRPQVARFMSSRSTTTQGHKYREADPQLYDKVSVWFREKERFLWPEVDGLWCN